MATTHQWKIERFSLTRRHQFAMYGKDFKLRDAAITLRLQFFPVNPTRNEYGEHCSLYLMLRDLGGLDGVRLKYRLWIENSNGRSIGKPLVGTDEDIFDVSNIRFGYSKFVHHDVLYSSSNDFVTNDTIYICCEVYPVQQLESNLALIDSKKLESDLRDKELEFYELGYTSTCFIQTSDGQKFEIERKKLMAHSVVFEKMFQTNMLETRTGIINMDGTSSTVIQTLIRYLHIHTIGTLDELAFDLFELADKYEIIDLKRQCAKSLISELTKDNILDRLIFAFRHNYNELKRGVLNYLSVCPIEENFRQIIKTVKWKRFMMEDDELSNEIIDAVFEVMGWC